MEATAMEEEIEAHSDFATEFRIYCTELHQNFVENGKELQVMTIDIEKRIIEYLLQSQENEQCPTLLSGWLEQYVFCVVANMEQTTFELHIWNEDQKKAVSMENYYSILSTLYSEYGRITADSFVEKVNEQFALIPEQIIRYFIDHCSGSKEVKKIPPKVTLIENKENRTYGCRVVNYDYVKKRVLKRKVVTEVFDKRSGKILHSIQKEEEPKEDYFYCIEKNDRLCDISNFHQTEISSTMYNSTQLLEVSYKDSKVKTYLPPDEIQNQEQLIILSDVIYKDREFSSSLCGEIHMEFVIPPKRDRSAIDLQSIFSTSFQPKSESEMPKSHAVKTPAPKPKPKTPRKVQPPPPVKPAGKLAIVNNPITKEQTLKCLPVDSDVQQDSQELSYSALSAAAIDVKDTDDNENFAFDTIEDGTATGTDKNDEESTDIVGSVQVAVTATVVNDKMTKPASNDQISESSVQRIKKETNEQENAFHDHKDSQISTNIKLEMCELEKDIECVLTGEVSTSDDNASDHQSSAYANSITSRRTSRKIKHTSRFTNFLKSEPIPGSDDVIVGQHNTRTNNDLLKEPNSEDGSGHSPAQVESKYAHYNFKKDDFGLYHCKQCPKEFRSKSGYYYHVRSHVKTNDVLCNDCGASFPNNDCLRQHTRLSHLKLGKTDFDCENCGRKFKSYTGLRYHKSAKHSDSSVMCEICGMNLKSQDNYKYHKKTVHSKTTVYKRPIKLHNCDLCTKVFRNTTSLAYHKTTTHSNGEKLICVVCGAQLKSELTMKAHMKTHDNRPDLQCNECGKQYITQESYTAHMNIHNGNLPYPCKQCNQAFPSVRHRMSHTLRVHKLVNRNQFNCEICQKSYKNKKSFKYHILTHTGEKPHTCPECYKSFRCSSTLHIHRRTHNGNKCYVCDFCGTSFYQKGNLVRHMKSHLISQ